MLSHVSLILWMRRCVIICSNASRKKQVIQLLEHLMYMNFLCKQTGIISLVQLQGKKGGKVRRFQILSNSLSQPCKDIYFFFCLCGFGVLCQYSSIYTNQMIHNSKLPSFFSPLVNQLQSGICLNDSTHTRLAITNLDFSHSASVTGTSSSPRQARTWRSPSSFKLLPGTRVWECGSEYLKTGCGGHRAFSSPLPSPQSFPSGIKNCTMLFPFQHNKWLSSQEWILLQNKSLLKK